MRPKAEFLPRQNKWSPRVQIKGIISQQIFWLTATGNYFIYEFTGHL